MKQYIMLIFIKLNKRLKNKKLNLIKFNYFYLFFIYFLIINYF